MMAIPKRVRSSRLEVGTKSQTDRGRRSKEQELVVVADVVACVVLMGGEDQQDGVGRVVVLGAPHHRRYVQTGIRAVESELLAHLAVVHHTRHASDQTQEKLLALVVGMLAPDVLGPVSYTHLTLPTNRE